MGEFVKTCRDLDVYQDAEKVVCVMNSDTPILPACSYMRSISGRRYSDTSSPSVGMTLIEIIVVLLIMTIIMSLSVPAFVGMGRGAGMRGTVAGVRSTLSLARQWAITHNEDVTFVCHRDAASGFAFTGSTFHVINQSGTNICNVTTNSLDVNFTADSDMSVTFQPDGGLINDPTAKHIYIEDRKSGVTKTITIYGLTGGIKVE